MTLKKIYASFGLFCLIGISCDGQNLLNLVDSVQKNSPSESSYQSSTWKDTRLIGAQTTKTPAPGVMVFRIMHRFGNMGSQSGGFHTLYGFDIASDIYFSFEFGLTKNLEVGFGRSMQQELIDVMAKYRILTQKEGKMPVSLAFYEDAGVTPELNSVLYADAVNVTQSFGDRLSYFSELILDRRFGEHLSAEVFGGLSHRNYVLQYINPGNSGADETNIPFAGAGAKIGFSKHSSIVFDYYYIISSYRMNSNFYANAFSIGYEVETGGHVFEINLSNASFINENNIVPYTFDSWASGGFKLGFSISRAFNIKKSHEPTGI